MTKLFFKIFTIIPLLSLVTLSSCSQHENADSQEVNTERVDALLAKFKGQKGKDSLAFYLNRLDEELKEIPSDSARLGFLHQVASQLYVKGEFEKYLSYSKESLDLAKALKDTANAARSLRFMGFAHRRLSRPDSALFFFKEANSLYDKIRDDYNVGRMHISMAYVREDVKDYTGAQADAVTAIKKFDKDEHVRLTQAYTALGNALSGLNEEEKAIEYYGKAIDHREKSGGKANLMTLNNIAVMYRKLGNYQKAIDSWESLIANEERLKEDPYANAYVIDNLAHTKLLSGVETNVEEKMLEALLIREDIKDYAGQVINHIHLSEYYISAQDTLKAKDHLKQAIAISYEAKDYGDILKAIKMLSDLETGETSTRYANDYIRISDSLQLVERNFRNKFARIQFETDRVIQEKELLSRQKWWISAISAVMIISLMLFYIIRVQKSRNKQLLFEQQQQQSNEEIYNLMLSQQDKVQEGRKREQQRISEELHDGVLSRLFGTRLNLDTLNEESDTGAVDKRKLYINELKSIEQEIRRVSHDLNDKKIEESQFMDIVRELVVSNDQMNGCDFELSLDESINWKTFDNKSKIHIYRILQESIQNINKYSKAKKATINFDSDRKNVILRISDDGVGFKKTKKQEGIGHRNIRSRVTKLDGKVSINSAPKKGTTIEVSFPSK